RCRRAFFNGRLWLLLAKLFGPASSEPQPNHSLQNAAALIPGAPISRTRPALANRVVRLRSSAKRRRLADSLARAILGACRTGGEPIDCGKSSKPLAAALKKPIFTTLTI